jgi:hypothetical protein
MWLWTTTLLDKKYLYWSAKFGYGAEKERK